MERPSRIAVLFIQRLALPQAMPLLAHLFIHTSGARDYPSRNAHHADTPCAPGLADVIFERQ